MARKKTSRALARLPDRRALGGARHKTERLIEILRGVAVKNQQDQPRSFYSVREVAFQFRVPLSTVSRVYGYLEQEGLLNRVRGSKTVLQGLHFDRQLSVRAFVGLPASLSAFVTIQAYRMFFIRIRRELRLRGFATAMAFFEKEEATSGRLSERLKAYEVDTVLWFQPPKEARETALRLSDMGMRIIGVAHDQFPVIPCRYEVRRDNGIGTLLTAWKRGSGVDEVTLVQLRDHSSDALEETLHAALESLDIRSTVVISQGQRSELFLRSLQELKTGGIIFSSAQLASKLCFRSPSSMIELLGTHRVAFLAPVSMPFTKVPDVAVDLIEVDWQMVCETIVNDLISQEAFLRSGPTVFEAEAKLRVSLRDFAQKI